METMIKYIARGIELQLRDEYQRYLDDCERDRADGYRPHYCEHGANLWVDYDVICGPCEDGVSLRDGQTRREVALDQARRRYEQYLGRIEALNRLKSDDMPGVDWSTAAVGERQEWAFEPIKSAFDRIGEFHRAYSTHKTLFAQAHAA